VLFAAAIVVPLVYSIKTSNNEMTNAVTTTLPTTVASSEFLRHHSLFKSFVYCNSMKRLN
jgi:hypothetical protein